MLIRVIIGLVKDAHKGNYWAYRMNLSQGCLIFVVPNNTPSQH